MQKILLILLMFLGSMAIAQAQSITGMHAQKELTCANCHGDAPPTKRAPASACTQCHGDYEAVIALTKEVVPNPHDSHQGEVRCTLCHKSHEPSVLYCNECHQFDLKIK